MASDIKDSGVGLAAPAGEAAVVEVDDNQAQKQLAAAVAVVNKSGQMVDFATESTLLSSVGAAGDAAPALATNASGIIGWLRKLVDAVTGTLTVSVSNEIEIKNDANNPLPVTGTVELGATALNALENVTVSGTVELGSPSLSALENITVGGTVELGTASLSALENINVLDSNLGSTNDAVASSDAGTFSLIALFKRLLGKFPGLLNYVPAPSAFGWPVRPLGQKTYTCSFAKVGAGLLSDDMTLRAIGTGVGVTQASGNLLVTTGTSTNAEFLARSTQKFNGALIARYQTILSQRIANQNFEFLLADIVGEGVTVTINSATSITVALAGHNFTSQNVGQSMMIGAIIGAAGVPGRYAIASIPDADHINFTVAGWPATGSCTVDLFGYNYVHNLYNGVTATSSLFDCQRKGWNSGDTTLAVNTSASPGHVVQIVNDGRNVFCDDMLIASSATPDVSATRGHRVVNIPDDELDLYVYLWSRNGSTAPASTTTWTVGFWSVEDFVNFPVYIAGQRMQGNRSPFPVKVTNAPTVNPSGGALAAGTNAIGDVGVQYRASATGGASAISVLSPATPAATAIKAAAGRLLGWQLINTSASVRSIKIWNTAVAGITIGTTAALWEIDIPAGGSVDFRLEAGIAFATAISYAVTGAKGLTDNTGGLGANDVSGSFFYA